jgi:hypothetical protein
LLQAMGNLDSMPRFLDRPRPGTMDAYYVMLLKTHVRAVSAIYLSENFVGGILLVTGENDSCIRAGLRIVEIRRDPRSSSPDASRYSTSRSCISQKGHPLKPSKRPYLSHTWTKVCTYPVCANESSR